MRKHYLLLAASACLLVTSGLAYAQAPTEAKKGEPKKEQVEKGHAAKAGDTHSQAKPQEKMHERSETGTPLKADEGNKPVNAAEKNGAPKPEEHNRARGDAVNTNERSHHENAAESAHRNREESVKPSTASNANKSASEKSAEKKPNEEKQSGAAATENSPRGEAAKALPEPSQQSSTPGNKGSVANDGDRGKTSSEMQHGANSAQPNSATSASAQLPGDKKIRISETLKRHELAPPERNLNISVAVGAEIPDRVRVHRLPPEIVSIVPEYRDYDYFTTDDDIVIVEPRTHRIISEIPRDPARARAELQGGATTATTAGNLSNGPAAPCQIQKRDASGQLSEVSPSTIGSAAQSHNSIAVTVQTPDQRSTQAIALGAPAGQIVVATQGPGDCRVTIEPETAK